jgi:hypothetical protein
MKKMLSDADQRLQFRIHVVAVLAAAVWPSVLVYPAALAFSASGALLEVNLLKVLRYVRNPMPSCLGSRSSHRQPTPATGISIHHK